MTQKPCRILHLQCTRLCYLVAPPCPKCRLGLYWPLSQKTLLSFFKSCSSHWGPCLPTLEGRFWLSNGQVLCPVTDPVFLGSGNHLFLPTQSLWNSLHLRNSGEMTFPNPGSSHGFLTDLPSYNLSPFQRIFHTLSKLPS